MTTYNITAPEDRFSGEVAGVTFSQGKGTLDGDSDGATAALSYFRRRGYGINGSDPEARRDAHEPTDPRTVQQVDAGALRDGAVEPRPGDAGLPTNAGEANPHGAQVVSPGRPTPPATDKGDHTPRGDRPPARSASKGEWQDYARSQARDSDENDAIDGMTKDELIERYGQGGS
ncbi:hypothetical protein [Streptomyces sp. DASNCL29]|uniref:hypothetical protein n=1 Tax=Streptomyces sp. DASNCL29 TaxID=2583819 RepID=UPI00110F952F|nr:hypothetical protein [Streptomyces sp. DASNCL29]TMU98093.1 hypothetical protein FGK60_09710 [Streptomyces sp. DASNCL29]